MRRLVAGWLARAAVRIDPDPPLSFSTTVAVRTDAELERLLSEWKVQE